MTRLRRPRLTRVDRRRAPAVHQGHQRAVHLQRQLRPQPDGRGAADPLWRRRLRSCLGGDGAAHGEPDRGPGPGRDRDRLATREPVDDLADQRFDYVITLSDSARDNCRPLPGPHNALHWHLPDPSGAERSEEDRIAAYRATRTELSVRLRPFIEIARRTAGLDSPER